MKKMKQTIISIAIMFQTVLAFAQQGANIPPLDKPVFESNLSDKLIIPTGKAAIEEAIENKVRNINRNTKKIEIIKLVIVDAEAFKIQLDNIITNQPEKIITKIESLLKEPDTSERSRTIQISINELLNYLTEFRYNPYYYDRNNEYPELSLQKLYKDFDRSIDKYFKQIYPLLLDQSGEPISITETIITDLKTLLKSDVLFNLTKELKTAADLEIQRLNTMQTDLNKLIEKDKADLLQLQKELEDEESQIDNLAIKIGLPLFCLTILLLFLGPKILSLFDKNDIDDTKANTSQSVLLEISTVLLLTMSILILGLSDKITSEVLGTLIGGISGYVLNKMGTSQKTPGVGKGSN
jgi:hypothetical protein